MFDLQHVPRNRCVQQIHQTSSSLIACINNGTFIDFGTLNDSSHNILSFLYHATYVVSFRRSCDLFLFIGSLNGENNIVYRNDTLIAYSWFRMKSLCRPKVTLRYNFCVRMIAVINNPVPKAATIGRNTCESLLKLCNFQELFQRDGRVLECQSSKRSSESSQV
jgi:hypothetical protein